MIARIYMNNIHKLLPRLLKLDTIYVPGVPLLRSFLMSDEREVLDIDVLFVDFVLLISARRLYQLQGF